MKQVILLEHVDLDRLKAGESLQLTPQLMLSLEGRKARKSVANGHAEVDAVTERKRLYQAAYRARMKKPRHQPGNHLCKACGKGFASPNALGPHQRHCPGRKP